MITPILREWAEKSPEERVRWFRSLTVSERMAWLSDATDLMRALDPYMMERERPEPVPGKVRALRPTTGATPGR